MVEVEKIIDQAEAWNLRRGRRDRNSRKKNSAMGLRSRFPCDGQDDSGNARIHPEAVRDEDQERQYEPQIAATREVAVGNKVCCSPTCKGKNDAGQNQNDG